MNGDKMETKELIGKFFESGNIAIVGATDNIEKFGHNVFKEFQQKGFNVFPVNPNKESIYGVKCYNSINSLPPDVEDAVTVD